MLSFNAFTGVGSGVLAAGMSRTLHVPAAAAAAHPARTAHAAAPAGIGLQAATAIAPQRKRRTAAATVASVDRSPI
jgi:hypothetical protein